MWVVPLCRMVGGTVVLCQLDGAAGQLQFVMEPERISWKASIQTSRDREIEQILGNYSHSSAQVFLSDR